ncbi:MAG: trypsin-like peptidase domain-containing protein [Pseudomonadota bacterium]
MILRVLSLLFVFCLAPAASAQLAPDGKLWVQVASERDLDIARREAERYSDNFRYTRIFLAQGEIYAIALGVVEREKASDVLRNLIRQDRIPRDSLTTRGETYFAEIWSATRQEEEGVGLDPEFAAAIETERTLNETAKRALQDALLWTGHYSDRIDGKFGPNTRAAIRSFQEARSADRTGYLTDQQQAQLSDAAESARQDAGWRIVEDGPLGLKVGLATRFFDNPRTVDVGLRLSGRAPAGGALLSLLSFSGGRSVDDLYDSAKREFARETPILDRRDANGFTLIGKSGDRLIYTHAQRARDGARGFILSFDEALSTLMTPVARAMISSLAVTRIRSTPRIADTLESRPEPRREDDDRRNPRTAQNTGTGTAGTDRRPRDTERADLPPRRTEPRRTEPRRTEPRTTEPRRTEPRSTEPRRTEPRTERPRRETPEPRRARPRRDGDVDSTGTGFYVSSDGRIVTNFHVVDGCRQMIVDGGDEASVLATDRINDLALLQHDVTRAADEIARFAPSGPRLNSDVTVVGYPLYGLLGGLNVTRGVVSSLKGLRGDETFIQISAEVQPGNSGGPALNARGYVVGVVQSKLDAVRLSERIGDIPQNVNFAIRADIAQVFLNTNGVVPLIGEDRERLEPADLAEAAQKFTVLLECIK